MGRAEDIFEMFKKEGESAIDDFIRSRKTEELFLDFKRSANDGNDSKLHERDRENLAKAISGFGNSEGGVIVWGVDCSKDDQSADVARAKYPLKDVSRFVGWLENAVSGCTVPPHNKIMNHFVQINQAGEGYAITLIPKSDHSPHQVAIHGKYQYRYYIRVGSNFGHTPHAVLAGMFGRRPQPHIYPMFGQHPARLLDDNSILLNLSLMLASAGPGIASDIFITTALSSMPGDNCRIMFNETVGENWIVHSFLGIRKSLISHPDLRLPPEAAVQPISVLMNIRPPFTNALTIEIVCGCGQTPPYRFKLGTDNISLQVLYDEFVLNSSRGTVTNDYAQQFNARALNIPKDLKRE